MKHILVLFAVILFAGCQPGKKLPERDEPGVKVIRSDEKATEIQLSYPKYKMMEEKTPEGNFQRFNPESFPSEHLLFGNAYTSMPEVPVYTVLVALPLGAKPDKILVEPEGASEVPNVRLYPVQEEEFSSSVNPKKYTFRFDQKTYNSSAIRAKEWRTVSQVMAEPYNIWRISVPAVDYDPAKQVLTQYKNIRIRVDYEAKRPCFVHELRSETVQLDVIDEHLKKESAFIADMVINRSVFERFRCTDFFPPPFILGSDFLIVTTDQFLPAAQDLKIHKQSLGIRTTIVTANEILVDAGAPGGTLTDVRVKNWVQNFKNKSLIRLKWLLIMGDSEYIPTHYISIPENGSKCAGDQFYGQLDGGGDLSIPVIGIGRLPVDDLSQAQLIVDRIKDYELHPPSFRNRFKSRMTFAAQFQDDDNNGTDDRWFAETSEDIRDYLLGESFDVQRIYAVDNPAINPQRWYDGTAIPAELRKPGFPWNGNSTDVISAINDGRVIVYHRDHGYYYGWGTPGFGMTDLNSLNISGTEYPLVFSINCASGIFDNETANLPGNVTSGMDVNTTDVYWAEKFLRQQEGAIGIIGDTRNSSTVMNNYMAKGLFDAIFPDYQTFGGADPIYHLGDVLNHAKSYVANTGAGNDAIFKENTIYNLLGDPSLKVIPSPFWFIIPEKVLVLKERIRLPFKLRKPVCLSCPPFPLFEREPIFAVLTNPQTGEVISRTMTLKEGEIELPTNNFKGPAVLTISGGAVQPVILEVRL